MHSMRISGPPRASILGVEDGAYPADNLDDAVDVSSVVRGRRHPVVKQRPADGDRVPARRETLGALDDWPPEMKPALTQPLLKLQVAILVFSASWGNSFS